MKKYRVYNKSGFVEFTDLVQAQNYHSQFGIGDIEEIDLVQISAWNKQTYIDNLNEEHNTLFEQYYKSKNYITIGEISLWVNDETYGQEAIALITWWRTTCNLVKNYCDNVTEETVIEDFISTLPILNI